VTRKSKRRLLFLLSIALISAPQLRAETACPWLTQGTAADLLGGDVSTSVQSAAPDAGSCRFSLRRGAAEYTLEITVANTPVATCPPASPKVTGVGSEAFSCATRKSPAETSDMISGRVRTTYFTVRLTGKGPPDAYMTPEKRTDVVEQVSEEVAGSLF
jgi:hypothetical protein